MSLKYKKSLHRFFRICVYIRTILEMKQNIEILNQQKVNINSKISSFIGKI